jgi:hypothetical protein
VHVSRCPHLGIYIYQLPAAFRTPLQQLTSLLVFCVSSLLTV